MRMKKIVSFEFGNENAQFNRISFRLDLKVLAAILAVIIVFIVVFISAFSHSDSAKQQQAKSIGDLSQNHETTNPTVSSGTTPIPSKIIIDPEMIKRLSLIKNMTIEMWIQQSASTIPDSRKGASVIQMLSTLWVMGLKEEFDDGTKWIKTKYNDSDLKYHKYTYLATIEYMGSLLSCYALTNDTSWLDRAKLIGKSLKVEFDTPTGLPKRFLTVPGTPYRLFKAYFNNDPTVCLAEAGGQHLEFIYLADMTNDFDMKTKVHNARTFLRNAQTANGLYMDEISINSGKWKSNTSTLNWPASTFYHYLIKSYVQSNGQDEQAIEMYRDAIDAVVNNNSMIQKSEENDLIHYHHYFKNGIVSHDYYENSCYLGAMLALGADAMQRQLTDRSPSTVRNVIQQTRIEQHWTIAREVTETCHRHANHTRTKLPSESENYATSFTFRLAAEYAETYFVLWRLTHQTKYRDYAWELAQAINEHCRTLEGKFADHIDVYMGLNYDVDDFKPSELSPLSSTLKYLYLTFSEDTLLPLDQWVFNQAGQPLPVCGKNAAYPLEKCTNK